MDELIRRAIQQRRVIEFTLHGLLRVAEPHLFGVCKGSKQLLVFQIRGESRSGGLPYWRRVEVAEIKGLRMLDEIFASRLATPPQSGWDLILARVQ